MKKIINEIIVHLAIDYGAQEFFWHFPKSSEAELLSWWETQEDLTIYEKEPNKLPGKLMLANTDEDYSKLYDMKVPKVVLLDYQGGSYIILGERKYMK